MIPIIADRFRLTYIVIISMLNPIGPVRLCLMIAIAGNKPVNSVPHAEPSIPPLIRNIMKKPVFPLSKFILYRYIKNHLLCHASFVKLFNTFII